MESFRKVEDRLIFFLTTLCWWIAVRFEKDNVWIAKRCLDTIFPVVESVYFLAKDHGDIHLLRLTVWCLGLYLVSVFFGKVMWWMLHWHPPSISLQAGKTPNPNRYGLCAFMARTSALAAFLLILPLSLWTSLAMYILCTEPIPPQEKEKRRVSSKNQNLIPAM